MIIQWGVLHGVCRVVYSWKGRVNYYSPNDVEVAVRTANKQTANKPVDVHDAELVLFLRCVFPVQL